MIVTTGGVTAPKGFQAAGLRAGIKAGKDNKDMAMVYSRKPAVCAGTFTKNVVKAAPVFWDRKVVEDGTAHAIVINSGVANACTGTQGLMNCEEEARIAGELLEVAKGQVLVASTGVIGPQLPMDIISDGIRMLASKIESTAQAADDAAHAILTTDTHKKEIAVTVQIGDSEVTVGGMCKGAGMIHPNMGTMLAFITSDVSIEKKVLDHMVFQLVEDSFNMISVDGDTSTNDTCLVLCNGAAGNEIIQDADSPQACLFKEALGYVLTYLAKQIAGDGEGCTRLFEVNCYGACDKKTAKMLAKSVVCSSLTKAAVFGKDANWGRILCAMGYSGADFDPEKVKIVIKSEHGELTLVEDGTAADYSEEKATQILSGDPVICDLYVAQGDGQATAWGCDLTYEYVTINADYRS